MKDYNINVYMYLLLLSRKYIIKAIKKYQKRSSMAKDYHKLYYTIDYHMFTFTQILYAISERLKKEYPKDYLKLKKFFKSKTVGAVTQLANNLKHDDTKLNSKEIFNISLGKHNKVTNIKRQIDRSINDKKNKILKNRNLSQIFEQADIELVEFLKENNYKF